MIIGHPNKFRNPPVPPHYAIIELTKEGYFQKLPQGSKFLHMTSEGLGKTFVPTKIHSAEAEVGAVAKADQ